MHTVVCIKQVPDTSEVRIDPKTNTMIRGGVPSIINPDDRHAIEAAVTLKEQFGGRVTILSMGPPQAIAALKEAISLGADEAVLCSDRGFAAADTLATSYVLWAAILKLSEEEPVDLVLCGKQAIDGDTARSRPASRRAWAGRSSPTCAVSRRSTSRGGISGWSGSPTAGSRCWSRDCPRS